MNKLDKIESKYIKTDMPKFRPGDKVRVKIKISEENKERIQVLEGIVIRIKGSGINKTFTVRKISFNNVGVERTFLTVNVLLIPEPLILITIPSRT